MPTESETIMKKTTTTSWIAALILAAAGCQSNQQKNYTDGSDFVPDSQERDSQRFVAMQSAVGARLDGELRDCNFSGDALNSLGREKLDLMLKDSEAPATLTVYLDLAPAESSTIDSRKDAIVAYLKDAGLADAQIKIENGPNRANSAPAVAGEHALQALDSNQQPAPTPIGGH